MAAPTTTGGSLTTATLTTIENYLPRFDDNVSKESAFWRYAKEEDLVQFDELNGREEILSIDKAVTTNGQWFDGLETLQTAPTDELTDVRVGHYNYTTSFYIGEIEKMENAGRAKLRSLLEPKMMAMERNARIDIAKRVVGAQGSNTRLPEGIRDLMGGNTPAAYGSSIGNLHNTAYTAFTDVDGTSAWGPHFKTLTTLGANNSNLRVSLIDLFLDIGKFRGNPRVGIADQVFYKEFALMMGPGREAVNYPSAYQVNYSGDRPAARVNKFDSGIPDLLFHNGARIMFDAYVTVPSTYTSGTDGHCNFIDPDSFKMVIDSRMNWRLLKPAALTGNDNQLAHIYRLLIRLTMRCYKRNSHGLVVINV